MAAKTAVTKKMRMKSLILSFIEIGCPGPLIASTGFPVGRFLDEPVFHIIAQLTSLTGTEECDDT
jgi:hypothetical protein